MNIPKTHSLRALTIFEFISWGTATQWPTYSSDYIGRHIAGFLPPQKHGTRSCDTAVALPYRFGYLNNITVFPDQAVTSLGPRNRWVDVYRKLDAMNLSIARGRVADIEVGGLTLGVDISFVTMW